MIEFLVILLPQVTKVNTPWDCWQWAQVIRERVAEYEKINNAGIDISTSQIKFILASN
jgi:hypothetical protein